MNPVSPFTSPERIVPLGWISSTLPGSELPPSTKRFTDEDVIAIAALCPGAFPNFKNLSTETMVGMLTLLASRNKIGVVRRSADNSIVAVGMLSSHDELYHGSGVSFSHTDKANNSADRLEVLGALRQFLDRQE